MVTRAIPTASCIPHVSKDVFVQEANPGMASAHTLAVDVTNAETVVDSLRGLEAEKGAVHVAVCVAGMCIPKLFQDQTIEEANRVMQVLYLYIS